MKKVLSVVLALAMMLSMCVVVSAAEAAAINMPTPTLSYTVKDGVVTAEVSVKGDVSNFDYGLAYDQKALTVEKITVNPDLKQAEDAEGNSPVIAQKNQTTNPESTVKGYVVVGCTSSTIDALKTWDGLVFTVTFKGTDGSSLKALKDSGKYYEAAVAAGKTDMVEYIATAPDKDKEGIVDGKPVDTTPVASPETPVASTPADNNQGGDQPAPASQAPASQTPVESKAPASAAPITSAPAAPKTADTANVVIPVVAIVAAAAAVVVVSKKRVEE